MMHLRVRRSIFVDHFRNNIARTFCSKPPGEENSPPSAQADDKEPSDGPNDQVTNKINDILKSMIDRSVEVQKEVKMPVPEYGFKSKKRTVVEDPREKSEREIREAAADVAKAFGNDPEIEKQLVSKALDEPMSITNLDWNKLITGMGIDNTKNVEEYVTKSTRSEQVRKTFTYKNIDPTADIRQAIKQASVQSLRFKMKSIDLLGGQPLGIFTKDFVGTKGTELKMWNDLEEYELRVSASHPPRNYFEKMIQWTNQGKIWKFPIDNDQGMEEEKKVHFTEHIFLEGYLEDWCPKRGPVRHFMELVCVGMSKNPYMPVKDKKEHIIWFKNYFESKKELLTQIGAYGNIESSSAETS